MEISSLLHVVTSSGMAAPAHTESFPQPILLLPVSKARSWMVTFNKLVSVAKGLLGKHEVSHEGAFRVIASEAAPGIVIGRRGREAVHSELGSTAFLELSCDSYIYKETTST